MDMKTFLKSVNTRRGILTPLLGASAGAFAGANIGDIVSDHEYAPHIGAGIGAALGGGAGFLLNRKVTAPEVQKALRDAEADALYAHQLPNMGEDHIRRQFINNNAAIMASASPAELKALKSVWNNRGTIAPSPIYGLDLNIAPRPSVIGALAGAAAGSIYAPGEIAPIMMGAALGAGTGHFVTPRAPVLKPIHELRAEGGKRYMQSLTNEFGPYDDAVKKLFEAAGV